MVTFPIWVLVVLALVCAAACATAAFIFYQLGLKDSDAADSNMAMRLRSQRTRSIDLQREVNLLKTKLYALSMQTKFWKKTARSLGWVKKPKAKA